MNGLPERLQQSLYHDWLLPEEAREVRTEVRRFVDDEVDRFPNLERVGTETPLIDMPRAVRQQARQHLSPFKYFDPEPPARA